MELQNQIGANLSKVNQIETHVKRCTQNGKALTVSDIISFFDQEPRYIPRGTVIQTVKSLFKKGIFDRRPAAPNSGSQYEYFYDNGDVSLYTPREKGMTIVPVVIKQVDSSPEENKPAETPDEIEVEIKGVKVVIGKNPDTGRIRIVIE